MADFTLLDYQKKTVDFGIKNKYSIYALQMGLGKSLCAIATAVATKSKALIVVPVYLAINWRKEIEKFYPDKRVAVFNHKSQFYYPFDLDFVIITYSFIQNSETLFEWADMVIYDEGQLLKNAETIRTEAAHRLTYENSIKRVLILTGTPILNRVYELHSLLSLSHYNPEIEESPFLKKFPTYVSFANHFSNLTEFEIWKGKKKVKVQQWAGHKNLDELKIILNKCMIRFKSSEVLTLPPQEDIFIYASDAQFKGLSEEFDKFVADDKNNSVMPRLKAKAALEKVPMTAKYVEDLVEKGLQVIVYTDHIDSAKELALRLGVTHIDGGTSVKNRQALAEEFQKGDSSVIVATIGSFSTGVNLQCAYNMVFNDLNWVPGQMDQAKFRVIRVGQTNKVRFHYIFGSFQDEYIYNRIQEKLETINAVI